MKNLIGLLKAKVNTFCDMMCNDIKDDDDVERAIEKICEVAASFGADTFEIGKLLQPIEETRIELTIKSIKTETKFKVQRKHDLDDDTIAEWILTTYDSHSMVSVELKRENYIHIRGNDWNLLAYGYHTLKSAIYYWAVGRM